MIIEILRFMALMIGVYLKLRSEAANQASDQKTANLDFHNLLEASLKEYRIRQMSVTEKIQMQEDEADRQIKEIQASYEHKGKGS